MDAVAEIILYEDNAGEDQDAKYQYSDIGNPFCYNSVVAEVKADLNEIQAHPEQEQGCGGCENRENQVANQIL